MFGSLNTSVNKEKKIISDKNKHRPGVFARFFLNYSDIENKYKASAIYGLFSALKKKVYGLSKIKQKVAEMTEKSIICSIIRNIPGILLSVPLRSYGIFAFFYGIAGLAINLLFLIDQGYDGTVDLLKDLFGSFVILALSVFLSSSHKCLGSLLANSKIMSFLLFDVLNFDLNKTDVGSSKQYHNMVFVLLGTVIGIIFGVLPQKYLVLFFLISIFFFCVMTKPEAGIIFTFLLLPFANEQFLFFVVTLCIVSVFFKTIRNKRVMKVSVVDVFVLLLATLIFLCGINGVGGFGGFTSSVKIILLLAFGWILNNTVRTTVLAEKCVKALILSTSFVAAVGIIVFLFKFYNLESRLLIFEILGKCLRAVPFSNDKAYADFAVLVVPFAFSLHQKNKFHCSIASIILIIYAVLSMDISVWVSLIFVSLIYICVTSPGLFLYFGIVIVLLSAVGYIFPGIFASISDVVGHLTNKEELNAIMTTSNGYGLKTVFRFLFAGAGSGKHVVSHVFDCFFGGGSSAFASNTSVLVRVLINYGICSIILIVGMYLCFLSNCVSLYYKDKFCKSELKVYIVGCLSSCSLIVFKSILFPSVLSSNLLLCAIMIFYISFSFRRCSLIEYAPEKHELLFYDDNI